MLSKGFFWKYWNLKISSISDYDVQATSRVTNQDVDLSEMPFLCKGNGPTKNNKSRARSWIPLKRTEREGERFLENWVCAIA
jgi:hypothetical protein